MIKLSVLWISWNDGLLHEGQKLLLGHVLAGATQTVFGQLRHFGSDVIQREAAMKLVMSSGTAVYSFT